MNNIKSFGEFINEAGVNTAILFGNMLNANKEQDSDSADSSAGGRSLNLNIPDTRDQITLKSLGINDGMSGSVFTPLDLKTPQGFKAYADIAQKWINKKNPASPIKGEMLATGAKKALLDHGSYIPPQLALAQLTNEGGLKNDPSSKPIRTKNPFNVGNVDSGSVVKHDDWQSGINAYFNSMAKSYVVPDKGKTAPNLLKNFVNVNGQRYAADSTYEKKIASTIDSINKTLVA